MTLEAGQDRKMNHRSVPYCVNSNKKHFLEFCFYSQLSQTILNNFERQKDKFTMKNE